MKKDADMEETKKVIKVVKKMEWESIPCILVRGMLSCPQVS
jgi:hypothetical protein